jgi:hypothetical protein
VSRAEPMAEHARLRSYALQPGRRLLTRRQIRRLNHKQNRAERRERERAALAASGFEPT